MDATIKKSAITEDLSGVSKEIFDFRKEMEENFANLHKHMSENTALICMQITEKQENNIKWMFVFWIGQVAATVGTILLFLKK
jgi:CRISPR/Cas system-associated protein endoribonuclease Cas2